MDINDFKKYLESRLLQGIELNFTIHPKKYNIKIELSASGLPSLSTYYYLPFTRRSRRRGEIRVPLQSLIELMNVYDNEVNRLYTQRRRVVDFIYKVANGAIQ